MDIVTGKKNSFIGKIEKVTSTIVNAVAGAAKYCLALEKVGLINSLEKSLIASLKGWANPISLTLLGPFRS